MRCALLVESLVIAMKLFSLGETVLSSAVLRGGCLKTSAVSSLPVRRLPVIAARRAVVIFASWRTAIRRAVVVKTTRRALIWRAVVVFASRRAITGCAIVVIAPRRALIRSAVVIFASRRALIGITIVAITP